MKRPVLLLVGVMVLLLGGCSHIFPKEARRAVDFEIDFSEVLNNPDAHRGATLLLGGQIVDNQASREGTTLEILNYRLDRSGEPDQPDLEGGRFLVETERFLDPKTFKPGLFLSLIGSVVGEKTRPLGDRSYRYPVLQIREAFLWYEAAERSDRYRSPPYYGSPYYRGSYRYDPFWYGHDPYGPSSWYPYDPYWDLPYPPGQRIK